MLNQQLSGVNAVIFYTVSIFKSSRITLDANEAFGVVGIAVTAKYMPETRNKSQREIQEYFASRR